MKEKKIALDFDDTLIYGKEIFRRKMTEVYQVFGQVLLGVAIKEEFEKLNNAAYLTYYVNPKRWDFVLKQFSDQYKSIPRETMENCREILSQIYTTVPEIKPGAWETLEALTSAKYSLGLVTHAYPEWTNFKLEKTGLRKFFPDGKVFVCHMDQPKGSWEWKKALETLDFPIEQTAVVGDSIRSDIAPAYAVGVRKLYWIHEPDAWAVQLGEKPPGTTELSNIQELIHQLC